MGRTLTLRHEHKTYKVVRYYRDESHPDNGRVIRSGLTLREARRLCRSENLDRELDQDGVTRWWDGYLEE